MSDSEEMVHVIYEYSNTIEYVSMATHKPWKFFFIKKIKKNITVGFNFETGQN